MAAEIDDTTLVEAAHGGDKVAFGVLVDRHRPLLLGVCRRALGESGLAEDAAQEAILQAMLSLDRLRRPDRFGPWLAGIGLNLCARMRRYEGRAAWSWEAMLGGRSMPEPVDPAPGPDELAEAAELRHRVGDAVAGLPLGQRAAVTLHYLAGLTQAETAALLGIEPGAVKTRLHKGRANLRRVLWRDAAALAAGGGTAMVEMTVSDVRRRTIEGDPTPRHFVLLAEAGGSRRLAIWIGEQEATALAVHLEQATVPRPLTYALMAGILRAAGGTVREVRIDRLEGDVFYAVAVVDGAAGEHELDARPSDALNLALLFVAPIRVAPAVLATVAPGMAEEWWSRLDEETEGPAVIAAGAMANWPPRSHGPTTEATEAGLDST
ncbi:MAG: DUF151 domain-containing protein [Chloroflexota bacterium]|nr:DUF151 domain-containing protein [Chloroflexota bacterium]